MPRTHSTSSTRENHIDSSPYSLRSLSSKTSSPSSTPPLSNADTAETLQLLRVEVIRARQDAARRKEEAISAKNDLREAEEEKQKVEEEKEAAMARAEAAHNANKRSPGTGPPIVRSAMRRHDVLSLSVLAGIRSATVVYVAGFKTLSRNA
ncbi:hypothetical protein BV22DRAFT_1132531 [Leucogyrophana mollusca]|uniref:Uncharacterized protein n=1 Tax=Leucogyrophana mollusca TaxID=85980 RepID=A0ACB8B783_9AGAM|nr:hypothetical protein BV22DRAFT_1132531 [Leucogyrophana mollusca]